MKKIYFFLAILGFILPLWQFGLWLFEFGIDVPLMLNKVIEDNLSLFAWLDVIISAIVLIIFIVYEGRKQLMRRLWIPIVGTLCVGVSFGLPLFLFLREQHFEQTTPQH
jgi:hypothetical protein